MKTTIFAIVYHFLLRIASTNQEVASRIIIPASHPPKFPLPSNRRSLVVCCSADGELNDVKQDMKELEMLKIKQDMELEFMKLKLELLKLRTAKPKLHIDVVKQQREIVEMTHNFLSRLVF
ncbi:hypothetical protein LINPERHAP1_LOCUS7524 [Linum perenne]